MLSVNQAASSSGVVTHAVPKQLSSARGHFRGAQLEDRRRHAGVARKQVVTENFKFMKKLGLKKPAFLPDFGLVRLAYSPQEVSPASFTSCQAYSCTFPNPGVLIHRKRGRPCWRTSSQALTRAPCNPFWQTMHKSQELESSNCLARTVRADLPTLPCTPRIHRKQSLAVDIIVQKLQVCRAYYLKQP